MANIEEYPDTRTVKDAIQADAKGDLNELNAELIGVTAGSGILVSPDDKGVGYFVDKFVAGNGIRLTIINPGLVEKMRFDSLVSSVATEADLGVGEIDGERRIVRENGNEYTWDNAQLKWVIRTGNVYSSPPATGTYVINDGTIVVIGGATQIASGGVFTSLAAELPVGAIVPYPRSAVPARYLECDGSAKNRVTYAALFAAIGSSYGDGDGSTTFNIPDLRGQFLRGWDHTAGMDPDAGTRTDRGDGTAGDNVGTKQDDNNKSHGHGLSSNGGHGHNFSVRASTGYVIGNSVRGTTSNGEISTKNTSNYPNHTHTLSASGGSESRPKNVNVMYCIFTG